MAYADVSVVVEGALEQEERFFDYLLMDQFIEGIREDAEGDGYRTEVYVVRHDHAELGEDDDACECVQFLQDHNPTYVFPWEEGA